MARIDSLLALVVQQGANELRVVPGQEPKMLAFGTPKRLTVPKMSEDAVRALLGELLSSDREELVNTDGQADVVYGAGTLGSFKVTLTRRDQGCPSATFLLMGAAAPSQPAAPAAAAPVARDRVTGETFESLVARAASLGASDVHLADGEAPFARVDGRLSPLSEGAADLRALLGPVMRELPSPGGSRDMGIDVASVGRIRLHAYATARGLAAAVRLLPPSAPPFSALHMPVAFDDLVDLRDGLVLVCGATGSGKSTTIAALVQEVLRRRSVLVVTLEDPIEYAFEASSSSLVRRRQVGRDVSGFAAGLRDALREDPDVLLVGEMRDPETIALALTAAETGHLVLSSLHSRSTASAIERIIDSYAPERQRQIRVQLADSLRAVVAQRLLPRARGAGRIPAVEVLRGTHATASLIRDGRTAQMATALQGGRRDGMLSLEHCLAELVAAGEVSLESARAASNDPASFDMYRTK